MFSKFRKRLHAQSASRDMLALALLNGLSAMALSGASTFGILAVLSGHFFIHGLIGVGYYVLAGAFTTIMGYTGFCLLGARLGLKQHTALISVFVVHAIGFALAAFVHPAFVSLSAGFSLGMFFAVFMLRSMNDLSDKARDSFATLYGIIQQAVTLIAPVIGAVALYVGTRMELHDPFFPAFLVFACSVLMSIPLIRLLPNRPLPYSVGRPIRKVFTRDHAPSLAFFISTIICDSMMNPMLIITSYALLGHVVGVGWFAALVAVLAAASLLFSQRVRLTGQRWVIMAVSLFSIGAAFALANIIFTIPMLLFAGTVFAIARANYGAAWFAIGIRVMEHEWGEFGKNRALIVGEICFLTSRIINAGLILSCGYAGLSLRASVGAIVGVFLVSATISSSLARFLDRRHKQQMAVV